MTFNLGTTRMVVGELAQLSDINMVDLVNNEKPTCLTELAAFVEKIRGRFGLQNTHYRCSSFAGRSLENPFLLSSYSQEWADHYEEEQYIKVDPIFAHASRALRPVDWTKLDIKTTRINKMVNEGKDAGVGVEGVTVPIRGPANGVWALFTATTLDNKAEWQRRRQVLIGNMVLVGNFVHQAAYELNARPEIVDLNTITRREREALSWMADGKAVADIGILMNISTETVKAHLDSACKKLGAISRIHALTKAMRVGLVA